MNSSAVVGQPQAARTRFLEEQCLLAELQGMLYEAQGDIDQAGGSYEGLQSVLQQQERTLPADAAASLAKHMQAASLIQRLRLPTADASAADPAGALFGAASASAPAPGSSDDPADTATTDQLGSSHHLLGVTPQHIRQAFLPSRKAAQKAHASLLPHLQRRLQQQAQAAVAAVTGTPAAEQGPGAAQQALAAVADKQAALARLRGANSAGLQQLGQEALGYLGELSSIHTVLQQLVGGCMLQEQPKLDQVNRKYQEANMQQLISKLQVMQLSIRGDTYTPENVAALAVIRGELLQAEQELRDSITQVESELLAYTQLGDDFHAVVEEYGDVLAQTRELDRVFEKFVAVENEAAALFG